MVAGRMYSPVLPDDGNKPWVAQFQPWGNLLWTNFEPQDGAAHGLAIDLATDDVFATGETAGSNVYDLWVHSLDAAGAVRWSIEYDWAPFCAGGSHSFSLYDGRAWIGGWRQEHSDCGSRTMIATVTRWMDDGDPYWNPDACCNDWWLSADVDQAFANARGTNGDYIIVGRGEYEWYLNAPAALIIKYQPMLQSVQWYVKTADHLYGGVATNANDDIIVVGHDTAGAAGDDIVVRKLDTNGDDLWLQTYDHAGLHDRAQAVAVDAAGYVYVAGWVTGTATGRDIWIAKYAP